jgi:sugar/nucleoside kinase (ribokinase family)
MFDILIAGEINPDLIITGNVIPTFDQVEKVVNSATLEIGSSSVIFACGAARLGLKVAFIGVCGDDIFGRFMIDEMQKKQIDTGHVILQKEGQTGLSVILNKNADRAILTFPGLIGALTSKNIEDSLLKQCRHLHVASYYLQSNLQIGLANLFNRAHSLGLTTSLDTNYDPTEKWAGLEELLPFTDIFLPNRAEALSITRSSDEVTALKKLAKITKIVAIKLGAQGALVNDQEKAQRASSIPVNVVDTVGAGDSFDAGFIYGFLNDWPMEKVLRLGCVCGSLSTQQTGGTKGQPTLAEVMKYVS